MSHAMFHLDQSRHQLRTRLSLSIMHFPTDDHDTSYIRNDNIKLDTHDSISIKIIKINLLNVLSINKHTSFSAKYALAPVEAECSLSHFGQKPAQKAQCKHVMSL